MRPAGFCNNCGRQLVDEARCPTCGAISQFARGGDVPTAAVPALTDDLLDRPSTSGGSGRRSLEVIRGRKAGVRFRIDDRRHIIGRAADAAIFLDDITVSRHHAEVFEGESGAVWVRDLGSMNGTYLNGQQVEVGRLVDGDLLQVGMFKLLFLEGV